MNTQERLRIYKKALKDYNYSLKKQTKWYGFIYFLNKHTECGFCHYFLPMHKLDVYEKTYDENNDRFNHYFLPMHKLDVYEKTYDENNDRFNLLLPELFSTKPKNTNAHWFSRGELEPRIACLEKAIKLCENKINENN